MQLTKAQMQKYDICTAISETTFLLLGGYLPLRSLGVWTQAGKKKVHIEMLRNILRQTLD